MDLGFIQDKSADFVGCEDHNELYSISLSVHKEKLRNIFHLTSALYSKVIISELVSWSPQNQEPNNVKEV